MPEINIKRLIALLSGLFVAILFWVFCITFTITIIKGQNEQIDANNASKETVTVYVEPEYPVVDDSDNGGELANPETQPVTQKETTNLDKYYMIDKAGNYVKGTLPYQKD